MNSREGERREKEKKRGREEEEERKRKKRSSRKAKVWNTIMETICVWKSCWNISFEMFGTYMLGNTCLSCVRKTLTLQYMCILVGLS